MHANRLGDLSHLSSAGKVGQISLESFALNKQSTLHLPVQETQSLADEFQNSICSSHLEIALFSYKHTQQRNRTFILWVPQEAMQHFLLVARGKVSG